jgi:hypothetical protein
VTSPCPGIIKLFQATESLVSDIPSGDGKIVNHILQCTVRNSQGSERNEFLAVVAPVLVVVSAMVVVVVSATVVVVVSATVVVVVSATVVVVIGASTVVV